MQGCEEVFTISDRKDIDLLLCPFAQQEREVMVVSLGEVVKSDNLHLEAIIGQILQRTLFSKIGRKN